jgi:hypothetical protein
MLWQPKGLSQTGVNWRRGQDPGGAAWVPTDIGAGLKAWYDWSDLTTLFQLSGGTTAVAADTDPIGYTADKSGNGNHITQATSGKRPLYKTSAGLSWALFDGTDDWLSAGDVLDLGTNSWWAVAGVKYNGGTSGAVFNKSHGGAEAGRYGLIRDSGSLYGFYDVDGVTVALGGNAADSSTSVRILTAQVNRSSGLSSLRVNAVAFGSDGSFTPESANQNNVDRFLVGAYGAFGGGEFAGYFLNGAIYGLILVHANATGTQITDAETWMAAKAGVTL